MWDVLTEGYVNGKQVASAAGKSVLSKCFCVVRLVFVCISIQLWTQDLRLVFGSKTPGSTMVVCAYPQSHVR